MCFASDEFKLYPQRAFLTKAVAEKAKKGIFKIVSCIVSLIDVTFSMWISYQKYNCVNQIDFVKKKVYKSKMIAHSHS